MDYRKTCRELLGLERLDMSRRHVSEPKGLSFDLPVESLQVEGEALDRKVER